MGCNLCVLDNHQDERGSTLHSGCSFHSCTMVHGSAHPVSEDSNGLSDPDADSSVLEFAAFYGQTSLTLPGEAFEYKHVTNRIRPDLPAFYG